MRDPYPPHTPRLRDWGSQRSVASCIRANGIVHSPGCSAGMAFADITMHARTHACIDCTPSSPRPRPNTSRKILFQADGREDEAWWLSHLHRTTQHNNTTSQPDGERAQQAYIVRYSIARHGTAQETTRPNTTFLGSGRRPVFFYFTYIYIYELKKLF